MTQNSDTTDGKSDMCDFLWADLDVIHRSVCLADVEQFGNEGSGQFIVDGSEYIPLHDQHTLLNKSYIQSRHDIISIFIFLDLIFRLSPYFSRLRR